MPEALAGPLREVLGPDGRTWRVARRWTRRRARWRRESDRAVEQVARGLELGRTNPAPDLAERAS